jgi:hypothetical protein
MKKGSIQTLAAEGFRIFPVVPNAKIPALSDWPNKATADTDQLLRWREENRDCNWGLATGKGSKVVVIDLDGEAGLQWLAAMSDAHGGGWVETRATRTHKGQHLFFRYPEGAEIRNSAGQLAKGVDVRGEGGYVVIPPSKHPDGAPHYEWLTPQDADILPLPQWLLTALIAIKPPRTALHVASAGAIGDGCRNETLARLAGTMRNKGMSQESIFAALKVENAGRCNPPLPESEVRQIAESIGSYPPGHTALTAQAVRSIWPEPVSPEAVYGLAGDVVRTITPHSEADPAALLVQFIVCFGSIVGSGPHFVAEADRHPCNLSAVIVGQTSKGRKGTALGQVKRVAGPVDEEWSNTRVLSGLSSGEGLIWAVRDPIQERHIRREHGHIAGYEDAETDPGIADKRLLVVETEFARVLQVAKRETNTISAVIRQAWDNGNLRILTKKQAAQSTGAHISIIGHITKDELRRELVDTAAANGFCNRILWVCAKRSNMLPEGGALHTVDLDPIIGQLRAAVSFAHSVQQMRRDESARELWHDVYPQLSDGKPGMFGSVTGRAEAQTVRLSCIYALLDLSGTVRVEHLSAALAVWKYCEDSARFIFGDATGDVTADEIIRQLRSCPEGMTRTDLYEFFSRHKSSAEIGRALGVLQEYGMANFVKESGQGRPVERWFASHR